MRQQEKIPAEKTSEALKNAHGQSSDMLYGQEKYPNLQLVKNVAAERVYTAIIMTMESLLTSNGCVPSATAVLTRSERRLIAAAPEMLAALHDLLEIFEGQDFPALDKARAALAKAEGRDAST